MLLGALASLIDSLFLNRNLPDYRNRPRIAPHHGMLRVSGDSVGGEERSITLFGKAAGQPYPETEAALCTIAGADGIRRRWSRPRWW